MLCNFLIQPHFNYACISWNPLVIQRKKYVLFFLKLNSRQPIEAKLFKETNGLQTIERVEQDVTTKVFIMVGDFTILCN